MARSQVRYHVPLGNIFGTRHFRIMGFMLGRQIYRPPKENTSGSLLRGLQKWYWGLADSFNPTKFEPAEWAAIMKDAGFKYLIFTTKHHDGFCMFDSKYTDYSIAKGPYKNGKYSNVAYHVFDAFRQQGFMIGAYFSKPDWHCEYYWDPALSTPTRNPNYDIKKFPETWAKYQQYTANQIDELMSDYGRMDILWLDGGWVRKDKGQDIKLDEIVDNARKKQPGLIAVDRTIPGRNENYQTPELKVPKTQLDHPWESGITLANSWGWNPTPKYKSASRIINTLAEITAKGGCLALNVGPTGEGVIEEEAIVRLKQIGEWLRKTEQPFMQPASLPTIIMKMYGSLPIRTEKHYMPFMHCPKEKNFRQPLNGKAMSQAAK